jgi:hypothetical protein
MPRATVKTETEHHDLKSCEDGFVDLRRMSFGEKNKRTEMIGNQLEMRNDHGEARGMMEFATQKAVEWEFANLIIDHNLEDEDGRKLDFKNRADIQKLDPIIGEEIGLLIDGMNNVDVKSLGNSSNGSSTALR